MTEIVEVTAAEVVQVQVVRLDAGLPLPGYSVPGDAGIDLRSRVDVILPPGQRLRIPTGVAVAIPPGFAGFLTPRSGLADSAGLGFVNAPGVIDSGYRGEIQVVAINLDPSINLEISRGVKIAQLVVLRVPTVELVEVLELPASTRGTAGFGSTGL